MTGKKKSRERFLDRDSMIRKNKEYENSNSTLYGIWFNCELSETEFAHVLIILLNQQTNQVVGCRFNQFLLDFCSIFNRAWLRSPLLFFTLVVCGSQQEMAPKCTYSIFFSSMSPCGSSKALGSEIYHLEISLIFFDKPENPLDLINVSNFIQ